MKRILAGLVLVAMAVWLAIPRASASFPPAKSELGENITDVEFYEGEIKVDTYVFDDRDFERGFTVEKDHTPVTVPEPEPEDD